MRLAAVFAALLLVVGAAIVATLHSFHYFSGVSRFFDGHCAPVTGIDGPEDIELDPVRRRAFISSLDRRDEDARGAVHLFDLDDPLNERGWRDITGGVPETFKPIGLDYYEDEKTRRLFVVNDANRAVEMFDVAADGGLVHLETFTERRLTSPNDVVAVGPRSFYVTNDVKPGRHSALAPFHFLTRTGSGQILYADGAVWRMAAENLRFANGVDVSADGERLYAAETAGGTIRLFDRDLETGALTPAGNVRVPAAPDNIAVDHDGSLWIGAHPKPLKIPRHGANPAVLSPSQVFRLTPEGALQSVYRDNGEELSASSIAVRLDGIMLVGALYDDKFLICDLPAGEF